MKIVKKTFLYLATRLKYPNFKTGFGTVIRGSNFKIKCDVVGRYTTILDSVFEKKSVIGDHCVVRGSVFSGPVRIGDGSLLNNLNVEGEVSISGSELGQCFFGNHIVVNKGCEFINVTAGDFSYFAKNSTAINASFGKFCSIGPHMIAGLGDHPVNFVSTHPAFFSINKQCGVSFSTENHFDELQEITVKNDVWIGAKVYIKGGVTIGNGAVLAAGAVVVENVPDYAIVGGVPAKIIKYRFDEETIRDLLIIKWWDWSDNKLREAQPFFCRTNTAGLIGFASKETDT